MKRRGTIVPMLFAMLGASAALAEPDTFLLGDGHQGPYTVAASDSVLNRYAALSESTVGGATELPVSETTGFTAGTLVMVVQSAGLQPVPNAGSSAAISASNSPMGRYELARVGTVNGNRLELTAPLMHAFTAPGAQVVSVPEYTTLTIQAGSSVVAEPWDGQKGGIVALLATGAVVNEGAISAAAAGFRGGAYLNSWAAQTACSGFNEAAPNGAQKGEGLATAAFGTAFTGRGNIANGGGGGVCHNSGGGGGGNGGRGGLGGRSWPTDNARLVGGMGGAKVIFTPVNRLLFGGGGGAGHGDNDFGSAGARGGGALFLRARSLQGSGVLRVDGQAGPNTRVDSTTMVGGWDGAGGGGAGGTAAVRVLESATCGALSANGGEGGHVASMDHGPGGGGGGGNVLIQASNAANCPVQVLAGKAGTQMRMDSPYGVHFGATPAAQDAAEHVGVVTRVNAGLNAPEAPVISSPQPNESLLGNSLLVRGSATPSATVALFVDGRFMVAVPADTTGAFEFTLTELESGGHVLDAAVELLGVYGPKSAPVPFTLATESAIEAPLLVSPTHGAQLDTATPTFSGLAGAGASLLLRIDGTLVQEFSASASGDFSYTLSAAQALQDGEHSASVVAKAPNGTLSPPATVGFTVATAVVVEDPSPGDASTPSTGCGCNGPAAGASQVAFGLLALLALARKRR